MPRIINTPSGGQRIITRDPETGCPHEVYKDSGLVRAERELRLAQANAQQSAWADMVNKREGTHRALRESSGQGYNEAAELLHAVGRSLVKDRYKPQLAELTSLRDRLEQFRRGTFVTIDETHPIGRGRIKIDKETLAFDVAGQRMPAADALLAIAQLRGRIAEIKAEIHF